MAEILCLATVLPQQGKCSFGYQDLVSSPQKSLQRPKGQEDKTNIQKPSERLSVRNKEEKQAFAKPFGARQCEKTSCQAFIKATHALQI